MLTSLITIGSQTTTFKAQKYLRSYGIRSDLVKIDANKRKGCIYGLRIPSEDVNSVKRLLNNIGIPTEE